MYTYQLQWAPSPRTLLWARACQPRSHWRTCWRSRPRHQWSCRWASGHQAGFRAPGSTVPSRHYRSGHRLDQHGWRCTHAVDRQMTVRWRDKIREHVFTPAFENTFTSYMVEVSCFLVPCNRYFRAMSTLTSRLLWADASKEPVKMAAWPHPCLFSLQKMCCYRVSKNFNLTNICTYHGCWLWKGFEWKCRELARIFSNRRGNQLAVRLYWSQASQIWGCRGASHFYTRPPLLHQGRPIIGRYSVTWSLSVTLETLFSDRNF